MNDQQKIAFKSELKEFCHSLIIERIEIAKMAMENAQASANNEEKSSAGDKYETSRAMSHIEKDMHAQQLAKNLNELATLHGIGTGKVYVVAQPGAFVRCKDFSFFIASGLGKHEIKSTLIYFLSLNAPLAMVLVNKKVGDRFLFNTSEIEILDIF